MLRTAFTELVGVEVPIQRMRQIPRFAGAPPNRRFVGAIGAMACYAGQPVGDVRKVEPAAEIVDELVEGAESLLLVAR